MDKHVQRGASLLKSAAKRKLAVAIIILVVDIYFRSTPGFRIKYGFILDYIRLKQLYIYVNCVINSFQRESFLDAKTHYVPACLSFPSSVSQEGGRFFLFACKLDNEDFRRKLYRLEKYLFLSLESDPELLNPNPDPKPLV